MRSRAMAYPNRIDLATNQQVGRSNRSGRTIPLTKQLGRTLDVVGHNLIDRIFSPMPDSTTIAILASHTT
jgi:hypothetical protein